MISKCWLGIYEQESAALLKALCKPGMTVFDVGANVGYFTLLFSRAVGQDGIVFAFEPDPNNLEQLRRHLRLNRAMNNVVIIPAAVTDHEGRTRFESAGPVGRVSEKGCLSVKTCRLDDFPLPDLVKMDIEGGEIAAIRGAWRILTESRTTWFIELHGDSGTYVTEMLMQHGLCTSRIAAVWTGAPGYVLATPSFS